MLREYTFSRYPHYMVLHRMNIYRSLTNRQRQFVCSTPRRCPVTSESLRPISSAPSAPSARDAEFRRRGSSHKRNVEDDVRKRLIFGTVFNGRARKILETFASPADVKFNFPKASGFSPRTSANDSFFFFFHEFLYPLSKVLYVCVRVYA